MMQALVDMPEKMILEKIAVVVICVEGVIGKVDIVGFEALEFTRIGPKAIRPWLYSFCKSESARDESNPNATKFFIEFPYHAVYSEIFDSKTNNDVLRGLKHIWTCYTAMYLSNSRLTWIYDDRAELKSDIPRLLKLIGVSDHNIARFANHLYFKMNLGYS